jgi:hypothetical protein
MIYNNSHGASFIVIFVTCFSTSTNFIYLFLISIPLVNRMCLVSGSKTVTIQFFSVICMDLQTKSSDLWKNSSHSNYCELLSNVYKMAASKTNDHNKSQIQRHLSVHFSTSILPDWIIHTVHLLLLYL